MIFKIGVLMIALFMVLIPISIAQTVYPESGFEDGNYFSTGIGAFNEQLSPQAVEANSQSTGLSDSQQHALVFNLDNTGLKEIIILDSNAVVIFNRTSNNIQTIDSVNVGTTGDFYSNMIVFDIDGDGFSEVLVANPFDGLIYILEYNGTDFIEESTVNISRLQSFNNNLAPTLTKASDVMIKCGAVQSCLVAYTRTIDFVVTGPAQTRSVHAAFFNSTNASDSIELESNFGLAGFCFPRIKQIQFKDYDSDGENEYVFSALDVRSAFLSDEELEIYRVNASVNLIVEEPQVTITDLDDIAGTVQSDCKTSNAGTLFTSPLVQDVLDGGDIETWIASQIDDDDFLLFVIEGAETSEDKRFPDIAFSDGNLISNVFPADAFADSDTQTEFCVFGQETTGDIIQGFDTRLNVLCASQNQRFFLNDELQFFLDDFDSIFGFNITPDTPRWNMVVHSVNMKTLVSEDTSEILTSFGVFDLSHDDFGGLFDCSIAGDCKLNVLFDNPQADGSSIPIDYEDVDKIDIIHVTPTTLHYLDDLFTNAQVAPFCGEDESETGQCSVVTTNPCVDSAWRINTSLVVTVAPFDIDGDQVSARVILYEGNENEQDTGFTSNALSGFIRTFSTPESFLVNTTIGDGNLQIQIVDTGNEQVRTLNLPFSVSSSGLIKGDCQTVLGTGKVGATGAGTGCILDSDCAAGLVCGASDICVDPDDKATLTKDKIDNGIVLLFKPFIDITGLAGTTLFFIVMIVISLGIWTEAQRRNFPANATLGTIGIINFLALVIGIRTGLLPVSIVIIVTLVLVAIIGVFLSRYLTGQRTGMM